MPLSIIYGDLNGLKLTNDIFGHAAGDDLIIKSANVMKRVCRKTDVIARVGGDEFVLFLPNTPATAARRIMVRIRTELSREIDSIIQCSMSMGTDTKSDSSQDIEQVLKNAESEMYREKTLVIKNNEKEMVGKLIAELHKRSSREKTHSESIGKLCELMAKALGWPEAEVKKIRDAGYYHDIGKVILSDKLIHRSGELTSLEKTERERHVVIGYRVLNLFDHTVDFAEPVFYHHEKWDGSGYPKGLRGLEIPIRSRIIAIAERYDHLTNLSNKMPLTKEEALKHIKALAGIKFDPELVDVFINVMRNTTI
jgi:diguanylate cyclase (GGDEF)-like protein/putative nucleotidyltransferase with HDIG domain